MAAGDLIDFDIIEGQKENIQSLPGGRSAKKLAQVFSPSPLHKLSTPTPADTKNVNDCIRAEYEEEIANISESDDPLDVYDRYVRWTFDAYPSAQATPQSQLHTLLERATKAFVGSAQYKNDPRYLKLWLHYIRFFADSPRETYVFLSRHNIGEGLALFYEEYAAWLESASRWAQAEEVYKLGIERDARPVSRLLRKFGEFEQRREQQPAGADAPASPALPIARPALAAKIDPFGATARAPADPQAPRPNNGLGGGQSSSKPGKAKLAVFSDATGSDGGGSAMSSMGEGAKGWDTIGSLADRRKENVMEAKPWAGETLATSVKKSNGPKMSIFRDPSLARIAESHIVIAPSKHQVIVNPQNGKRERVFVNLEAVYPTPEEPGTELSFEEIWAASRGWLDVCWEDEGAVGEQPEPAGLPSPAVKLLNSRVAEKLVIHHDAAEFDENGAVKDRPKPSKSKKKKVMEVNETQIIKAKLDSPSGPKIKKKNTNSASEPTMTMHTRAATDEIYDIFNAPLKSAEEQDGESDEEYMTDGDYTSGGESTGTTRRISTSEAGDDEEEDEASDAKSESEWSDFTAQKHIPRISGETDNEDENDEEGNYDEQNDPDVSDLIDTRGPEEDADTDDHEEDSSPRTRFIPIPPEDYQAPTRPYRDPAEVANNRLPFMTPITERTESSLGLVTGAKPQYFDTRNPRGNDTLSIQVEEEGEDNEDFEPLSSPLREVLSNSRASPPLKIAQPLLPKPAATKAAAAVVASGGAAGTFPGRAQRKAPLALAPAPKGPIITDAQCNPVDAAVREAILARAHPPLESQRGFFDHRGERFERGGEIRRFARAAAAAGGAGVGAAPVVLEFPELAGARTYTIRRELGAGAFAPVYLAENSAPDLDSEEEEEEEEEGEEGGGEGGEENDENRAPRSRMGRGAFAGPGARAGRRARLEAVKMEQPPSAWEFHMMRLAAARLGAGDRAAASVSAAHELHLYADEGFLVLPYHGHGTLLDVVNFFRGEQASGVMDEALAVFFAIELLRTVEALHARGLMHGDLKVDNCLLRLDGAGRGQELASQWRADGSGGWAGRGVVLIDFGRGVDMRAFGAATQFVADWRTGAHDCAEMREGRPWTWQMDYHGLAGTLHTLLFGKYIETVRADDGRAALPGTAAAAAAARRYKLRDALKRYWQTDIWADCFDLLLNPAAHAAAEDGGRLPALRGMRRVRARMEAWLEANCEKGVGLRGLMARVEAMAAARARKH
ncbi:Mad3/BUB1 homology region 1-domain-containing protein [Durotheca rogersii]|uniref:Mad3/BUB1 homology region 1-domain-containing protein n=1 Tax=Durotheca rogersii TaxID=419775 RepID=UPI00221E6ED4|nr:Mad3/BUB1 homology region 1-domain-containing protein [Durotheca rogersii]KAI5862110.1 Mad3/BUB1 homology region 1-domain-containing protein [Durotheca rogersii]